MNGLQGERLVPRYNGVESKGKAGLIPTGYYHRSPDKLSVEAIRDKTKGQPYATAYFCKHLLENGTALPYIQLLLGHFKSIKNPLD